MDVDDFPGHGGAQCGGEDLHIPRENDEVDAVFLDE